MKLKKIKLRYMFYRKSKDGYNHLVIMHISFGKGSFNLCILGLLLILNFTNK